MPADRPSVLIVGGGLAGIAAAVALARQNVPVTLLESRDRLGGRASSFTDKTTGELIDNCQHVTMGCCTNFRHLMETLGLQRHFVRESTLRFIDRDGGVSRMTADPLPAPWHLARSFAGLRFLSVWERVQLALGLRRLMRERLASDAETSFADWLSRANQPPRVRERFWHTVLVSALSESLDRIHVAAARQVFLQGMLAHHDAWAVWLPTVPLGELYGLELSTWLAQRGVDLRLRTGVKQLRLADKNVAGVQLRDDSVLVADHYIVAVPASTALSLIPPSERERCGLEGVAELEFAPIASVHVWFDSPIMEDRHVVLVDRLSQWVFNRHAIQGKRGGPWDVQVVISAAREIPETGHDGLVDEVLGELREVFPASRQAKVLHARAVVEYRAALTMKPGVERHRSRPGSPMANLSWAGDWTQTGWPSTMEGATRSGFLAAEHALARPEFGHRATPLVRPDLPSSWWTRCLFGESPLVGERGQ